MFLSCGRQTGQQVDPAEIAGRTINIVSTTGMIGDAVKNIGGERVSVISLMGPGIDPHLYKASEGDVTRMSEADIIFYNGLHLEGKMAEVLEQMQSRIRTVAVTDSIDRSQLLTPPEYSGNFDPHVWFDVSMWQQVVVSIRDVLVDFDPQHASTYQNNCRQYLATLGELHEYVLDEAATVDENQRVLVTAHDAFNYFGQAYGFEVKGLQGISTATEAGTADVQGLSEFILERKIPAIFVETSVPPRFIEALQAAVQSRGFEVQIGGNLFSDAMGSPGTEEGTYTGMVRHNINTIVGALVGEGGVAATGPKAEDNQ